MDADTFRQAMGCFATGVAVVTASGENGPAGLTTNAVSSLSLDPLLLLVCFDNDSRTLPVVRQAGRFAVNILAAGQEDLATIFASKRVAEEKFEAVSHTEHDGVPLIDGAAAWITADLMQLVPGGDHTIGIGEATRAHTTDLPPLVFHRGAYVPLP